MPEEILVTVVVPAYNVGAYLRKCLDSVVRQTHRCLDVLVIDDGSTDDSGAVCDEFARADERFRVLHTENRGVSAVRNLGIREARGAYFMTVDGDDWLEPSAAEEMLAIALERGADVVCASHTQEFVGKSIAPASEDGEVRILRGDDILSACASGLIEEVPWSKLFRTSVLAGLRYPEGHVYEDVRTTWSLMSRLAASGGVVALTERSLVHNRTRAGSITHDGSLANCRDFWVAHHTRYEELPELRGPALAACMFAIGRMWGDWGGFPPQDRKAAGGLLREMRDFSRVHRREVMSAGYDLRTRLYCLFSQTCHPVVLYACHLANIARHVVSHAIRRPFP